MLTTIIIVFVLYLGLMLAISWMGRKHSSSFSEYLIVDGKSPLILLIGGAVGAQVGNGLVVGGAGSAAGVGLAGVGYGLGCALSYLIIYPFTKKIRENGCLTPPEFIQAKYQSKGVSQLLNVVYAISVFPSIGAQMMAAKVLFDALGLNGTYGVIALCVVVFLYSQISGLWGALATSVVQICIIGAGVLIGCAYIFATGGWGEIVAAAASGAVPETFTGFGGYDLTTWILCLVPVAISAPIDNVAWQRVAAAKDLKTAKNHFWMSSLIMIPICFAPVIIGMYGRVVYGVADNTAFFNVILHIFPPVLAAFVVVAVIAAVMSTIDGSLIAESVIAVRGIYKNVIDPEASDEKMQKLTLPVNIATILISAWFAFSSNSIIGLLSNVYLFVGSAALAPVILGWYWKDANKQGAMAGIVVGSSFALLQLLGIYELPYSGITFLIPPFVSMIVVSLLTKKKTQEVA